MTSRLLARRPWRAVRTRSRWRAETGRRRSSPPSPRRPAFPTPVCRPGLATTSRSTSGSTATTSSGRSTRSWTPASAGSTSAKVNGRVFVNNVSLGLYAEAVQRSGYRDAKLRTILDTIPDVLGPEGDGPAIRWTGPGGHEHHEAAAILVSNNRYRLGRPLGSRHPSADRRRAPRHCRRRGAAGRGVQGDVPQRPWRDWSEATFEVDADRPVPAGIDGEATVLEPPLRFRIRSGALRVRVARRHPGASPSARIPEGRGRRGRTCADRNGARSVAVLALRGVSATLHFRRKTLYFLKLRQGS